MGNVMKRDASGHLVPTTDLSGIQKVDFLNKTALVANADGNKYNMMYEFDGTGLKVFDGTDPHAYNLRGLNDGSAVGTGAHGVYYPDAYGIINWPGNAFPQLAVSGAGVVTEGMEAWIDSDGGLTAFAYLTSGKQTARVGVWCLDGGGLKSLDYKGIDPSTIQLAP